MNASKLEGYVYEVARARNSETGEYSAWSELKFSPAPPDVPEGAVRNLRAVYSSEEAVVPVVSIPAAQAREVVRQIELAGCWSECDEGYRAMKRQVKAFA